MLVKLAWRNVRRSARDYAVYFITLMLGVALFYAFNSISSQQVLFDALSTDSQRMFDLLSMFMGFFSGVVAFVLAFLVLYANRFLIKRRKREFGMYLMLGMRSGHVTRILLYETLIVGISSLVVGMGLGILLSQGLSFVTAALMAVTMGGYHFIVSRGALLLTLACFAVIFVLSAAGGVLYVSRCKLADLLTGHEKSERGVSAHPVVRALAFIVSLALLACAYRALNENGLVEFDGQFALATALMIVGTALFFWSFGSMLITALRRVRGIYLKGLATFTLRQLSSKVNTMFASMTAVCVILFLAITTVACGMGLIQMLVGNLEETTQYDATISAQLSQEGYKKSEGVDTEAYDHAKLAKAYKKDDREAYQLMRRYDGDIAACLRAASSRWDELVAASGQLDYYRSGISYGAVLDGMSEDARATDGKYGVYEDDMRNQEAGVVGLSQFNQVLALTGHEPLTLAEDECAVNNTFATSDTAARVLCAGQAHLSILGHDLHFTGEPLSVTVRNSAIQDEALCIIVPDAVIDALKEAGAIPVYSYLDVMYTCDRATGDRLLEQLMAEAFPVPEKQRTEGYELQYLLGSFPVSAIYTGQSMIDQASGTRMAVTYLAFYIGIVLLIATAAILAIQQLSEVSDSLPRYRRLATLGCAERSVYRSLKIQTAVYFLMPLGLAACHTTCAIYVLGESLFKALGVDITGSIALAATLVCVIYACYLLVTYLTSRSMVKAQMGS